MHEPLETSMPLKFYEEIYIHISVAEKNLRITHPKLQDLE